MMKGFKVSTISKHLAVFHYLICFIIMLLDNISNEIIIMRNIKNSNNILDQEYLINQYLMYFYVPRV